MLLKPFELAPEVGLEPTTTRLTAACSTIELLWNPKRRVIYWASLIRQRIFRRAGGSLLPRHESVTSFIPKIAGAAPHSLLCAHRNPVRFLPFAPAVLK